MSDFIFSALCDYVYIITAEDYKTFKNNSVLDYTQHFLKIMFFPVKWYVGNEYFVVCMFVFYI